MAREFIKFMRFTLQGIAIASFGTMGLAPKWWSFILGLAALIDAIGLLTQEKEN